MRAAEFATRLQGVTKHGPNYSARCPGHDDRVASLSFRDGQRALVVKCHAGCLLTKIFGALHLGLEALHFDTTPRAKAERPMPRREVAVYDYTDLDGILLYQQVRYDPKDFRPRVPRPDGNWEYKLPEDLPRVCYRLPDLRGHTRIVGVEGERDADTLWSHGVPATTTIGGSSSWRPEYAMQLKQIGIKELVMIPDADKPGEKYGQQVVMGCRAVGLEARIVRLWPTGPTGADVSDWFGVGHTVDELRALTEPPTYSIERRGDGFVTRNGHAALDIARIYEHRDGGIDADILASMNGLDHWSRLNMAAPGSRSSLAKHLAMALPGTDWMPLIDYTCQAVVKELRTMLPAVALQARRPPPIYNRFLIEGLVPLNMPTILYGDGASLKSLLSLAIVVAGLRNEPIADSAVWCVGQLSSVLMLDWEANAEDHEARLWGLCAGYGIDPAFLTDRIQYVEMTRPLHEALPQIKKRLADRPADLIIVDSLLKAAGDDPIDVNASNRVMSAIRELRTTTLVITHISHDDARSTGEPRIIGSVMYNNSARSAFWCRAEEIEIAPGRWAKIVTYGLPKSNVFGKWGPHALRFVWGADDVIRIQADTPDGTRLSLNDRILSVLRDGDYTVADIAEKTGATQDVVRVQLHRMDGRSTVEQRGDILVGKVRKPLWGLRHPQA